MDDGGGVVSGGVGGLGGAATASAWGFRAVCAVPLGCGIHLGRQGGRVVPLAAACNSRARLPH